MAEVISFAEESCFEGDKLRTIRREVYFNVRCFGSSFHERHNFEILSDYGLWYEYEDETLLEILRATIPDERWGWYVYHKKMDHSAIEILCPDSGKVVGIIEVRRRSNQKLSGETLGGTVMYWDQVQAWKVARDDETRARSAELSGEGEDPVVDGRSLPTTDGDVAE